MPKIVDKVQMQHRILDAAQTCLAKTGYHACKMGDLARAAGIAKGTLYLYFDTKDALVIALMERQFAAFEAAFPPHPPATLTAFQQRLSETFDMAEDHLGAVRLFFDLLGPGFADDAIRQVIGRFFDRLGDSYARDLTHLAEAGEIAPRGDLPALGRALAAMLDGMVIHRALFLDAARHRTQAQAALALILAGLQPAAGRAGAH